MKKFLAITIAVVLCISIFTFNAHPSNTIAQAAVNENNISVMNANVESTVQSVNLEGINAADIKQSDVTEYYRNQDSIANLLSTAAPAAVGTTWAKTYGGSSYDFAYSIQQTSDGGYIVAGYTNSFDEVEDGCLVIKLNSDGTVTWAKTYGGDDSDYAYSIQQTSDGGYIVAGYTLSFGGNGDNCLVVKLDSSGVVSWAKTYGGPTFDWEWAYSIQQTSDGGYIVAGFTDSFTTNGDFFVIKLNSDGVVSWAKTYDGNNIDLAYSIQQTSDGGYIVAGYTYSFSPSDYDALVIKLNSDGTVSWAKMYGGSGDEIAYSIQQTSDGGYIVAGYTTPFGVDDVDFLVIKLNSDGTVSWAKTHGGTGNEGARSIQQTSDGGYIVAGAISSFAETVDSPNVGQIASFGTTSINSSTIAAYYNFLVIKLDSNGEIGGSCDYLQDCSPTVGSPAITGIEQTTIVTTLVEEGFSEDTAAVITNSPTIQANTICSGSATITASAGTGGSISPSGSVGVNYNSSQTFTITTDFGYVISDVLVDGISVGSVSTYTFNNVTADHTISASFILKPIPTFTVAASVSVYGGYATVTPKEQTVQSGSPTTVTINPDAGYHITGLTDNGTTVPMTKLTENANGTYTYTIPIVYEDHNIVVTLEKNKYTIKAKAGEGGTISLSGSITVKYNETETFTITPDSGYKIDKILIDNKPITSAEQIYRFKNVKDNHTIEVTFTRTSVKTPLIITLQIDNPEITINGITKTIDEQGSKPIIENDRTLIPIRVLIESLDGNITWNEETREVTINLNYHTIVLTIDSNTAVVNGIKMQIDPDNSKVTPIIINGRTYLPLRFIVEHLDGVVDWDNDTRTVTIYYWP